MSARTVGRWGMPGFAPETPVLRGSGAGRRAACISHADLPP
jgi:hypothetical protein